MHDEKLIERIRKLFAKAEDAAVAGAPDAEVLLDKAMALLAKYGVGEALAGPIEWRRRRRGDRHRHHRHHRPLPARPDRPGRLDSDRIALQGGHGPGWPDP